VLAELVRQDRAHHRSVGRLGAKTLAVETVAKKPG
jgi:hypothetical protein